MEVYFKSKEIFPEKIAKYKADKQAEEAKKLEQQERKNGKAAIMAFVAILIYIVGFISSIILGFSFGGEGFSLGIMLASLCGFIAAGTLFIGLGEIIELLTMISKK